MHDILCISDAEPFVRSTKFPAGASNTAHCVRKFGNNMADIPNEAPQRELYSIKCLNS